MNAKVPWFVVVLCFVLIAGMAGYVWRTTGDPVVEGQQGTALWMHPANLMQAQVAHDSGQPIESPDS